MTEPAWEIKQELENEGLSSIVCGFYPANATLVCDFSDISSAVTLFCVGDRYLGNGTAARLA